MPVLHVPQRFRSHQAFRNHVINSGCFSPDENQRIFDEVLSHGPRWLFRTVSAKYAFSNQVVCDVGCGYGENLFWCGSGSYGVDIDQAQVRFAKSIGLNVCQRDVINDGTVDLPRVDVVWNSAVLEHVESPHIFLRKLYYLLKSQGLLALYVPVISAFQSFSSLPKIGRYFRGYCHGDHINAFSPQTLRFFCERAGFETIEIFTPFPIPLMFG